MSYPLTDWKKLRRGYTYGVPTFYSKFHLGLDVICPEGTLLYAWDDCKVTSTYGPDGGNTAFVYTDGKLFRFLHLKEKCRVGNFKAGDVFGKTGNTGKSTGPHIHIDISKNGKLELANHANFIDPEKYFLSIQPKVNISSNIPVMSEPVSTKPEIPVKIVPETPVPINVPVKDESPVEEKIEAKYDTPEPVKQKVDIQNPLLKELILRFLTWWNKK